MPTDGGTGRKASGGDGNVPGGLHCRVQVSVRSLTLKAMELNARRMEDAEIPER
jgi:hypothetical protein